MVFLQDDKKYRQTPCYLTFPTKMKNLQVSPLPVTVPPPRFPTQKRCGSRHPLHKSLHPLLQRNGPVLLRDSQRVMLQRFAKNNGNAFGLLRDGIAGEFLEQIWFETTTFPVKLMNLLSSGTVIYGPSKFTAENCCHAAADSWLQKERLFGKMWSFHGFKIFKHQIYLETQFPRWSIFW